MLANLTRIVKAQYAAKIGKSIEDLKDLPLEDLDISDLESSDGGSDSSVSDGPPKLPLLRKVGVSVVLCRDVFNVIVKIYNVTFSICCFLCGQSITNGNCD